MPLPENKQVTAMMEMLEGVDVGLKSEVYPFIYAAQKTLTQELQVLDAQRAQLNQSRQDVNVPASQIQQQMNAIAERERRNRDASGVSLNRVMEELGVPQGTRDKVSDYLRQIVIPSSIREL